MKKVVTVLLSLLFVFCMLVNISANDVKIIDEKDLLNKEEEEKITSLINDYIDHTGYDMVVYLANKHSEYFESKNDAITRLADDYFDNNNYGLGEQKEGIILCVDAYYRDYTITTHGNSCIDTYSAKALDSIYQKVTPYFTKDNAYDGVVAFISGSTRVYDELHESKIKKALKPSLIGAAIISLISFIVLASKLKSENVKKTAEHYMKKPKFDLTKNKDIYLYSNVKRTKIDRSSSNNSKTHTSSSGETHGGGGSHKI